MANSEQFVTSFNDGVKSLLEGFQKAETQVLRFERVGTGAEATAELITPYIVAKQTPPNAAFPIAATDITSAGAAIIALRTWLNTAQVGLGNKTPFSLLSRLL